MTHLVFADTQFAEATWIMIAKSIVIFAVIFGILPIGWSLLLSFQKNDLLAPPTWIGLDNYRTLRHDPLFADAVKRTLGTHPVVALEFEGDYYDTGTVPGYLRANLTLAMRREGLREELGPLLRELLQEWLAAEAARESPNTGL